MTGLDGARHTVQGRARGQRHGLLDSDDYHPLADPGSYASANAREAAYRPEPRLRVMSVGGCWCGLSHGHDWPGKDAGAHHPVPDNGLTTWWEDTLVRLYRRGLPPLLVAEVWQARSPYLATKLVRATDTELQAVADLWHQARQAEAS